MVFGIQLDQKRLLSFRFAVKSFLCIFFWGTLPRHVEIENASQITRRTTCSPSFIMGIPLTLPLSGCFRASSLTCYVSEIKMCWVPGTLADLLPLFLCTSQDFHVPPWCKKRVMMMQVACVLAQRGQRGALTSDMLRGTTRIGWHLS